MIMSRKVLLLAAALLVCVTAAQATTGTVTVAYTGVNPGEILTVKSPSYNGQAWVGVYNLNVTSGTGEGAALVGSLGAFCVDIWQAATTSSKLYNVDSVDNAPTGGSNVALSLIAGLYGTRADDLRRLFGLLVSGFDGLSTNVSSLSNVQAAAFQAAVWEIAFESSTDYDVTSGVMQVAGNVAAYANEYLDALGQANSESGVTALTNATYQDFVVYSPVPEPITMFSAFVAISGLGLYVRRRTGVAKA
jgi:hypothetical protein